MKWTASERRVLAKLRTPAHIQQFLDELPYDEKGGAVSPRGVLRRGKAQCYSGVLFACAALRELGHRPRMMWMDAVRDDGHAVALYQIDGLWGSVAKSNFTTIRSREPIYTYLALGLSYFDGFFNQYGERTMRAFTVPVELEQFEKRGWRFDDGPMSYIDRAIDTAQREWVLPRKSVKRINKVSDSLRKAGLMGANPKGLWRPGNS
jgi:hypothetical protein